MLDKNIEYGAPPALDAVKAMKTLELIRKQIDLMMAVPKNMLKTEEKKYERPNS